MPIIRKSINQVVAERDNPAAGATVKTAKMEGRRIIGVDPGTNILGYGVIEIKNGEPIVIICGVLNLAKYNDSYQKLRKIFDRLSTIITQYHPHEMALEAPFYGKNVQSMLKLGRAQGVAMSAALSRGIDVFEYAPLRVKQAVTGSGAASKEQVAGILGKILGEATKGQKLDATDALAVALCHFFAMTTAITNVSDL